MQYRSPGRTGVQVGALALSTRTVGAISRAEAAALVGGALAAGTGPTDTTSRSAVMPQRFVTTVPADAAAPEENTVASAPTDPTSRRR